MKTKTVETQVDLHAVAAATALSEIPDDAVRGVTTGDALEAFVRSQRASKLRVGDILKEMGLVTDEQITSALVRQKETHQRIGQILIESGVLSELDLTRALAAKFGVTFLDLTDTVLDPAAAGAIDEKLARRYGAAPVRYLDDNTLLVAMVDPQNLLALQDLEIITGYGIRTAIASEEDVYGAIAKIYRDRPEVGIEEQDGAALDDGALDVADIREMTDEAPIVKLVNSVIAQAVDDNASDIHFEPQTKDLAVRFRVDGVLQPVMSIPRRMLNGVLSRLKIMADLDIAERRVPQDGRIGLMVGGKPIDMRVATLPTVYGEKVVMRLLDKSNVMLDLEDLGFSEKALKRFRTSFTRPYGAILVTGPTGSGKSTTLYAALNILNSIEKNIITVEDPVEYRLSGINQVQVNTRAGMTFSAALRSILRCDPDIVMIGEIRDRETAQIAVESALTGHLGPEHAAHERRPRRALTLDRDGHRALPHVVRRGLRACAAPCPSPLLGLQGALHGDAGDAAQERLSGRSVGARRCRPPPRQGLFPLQGHGLQRPTRPLRSDDRERGDPQADHRAQERRRDLTGGQGGGHERPSRRWHRQSTPRADLLRGDRPGHHLTPARGK